MEREKLYTYIYIYIQITAHAIYKPKGHSKFDTKNWKHPENIGKMQTMKRNKRAGVQL